MIRMIRRWLRRRAERRRLAELAARRQARLRYMVSRYRHVKEPVDEYGQRRRWDL